MQKQLIRILMIAALLLLVLPIAAQETATTTVTDDQVNAIAKKLYCPVCENIPLDACGTSACQDWRYEIRLQLESGMTEQQITDDFVRRFGDRVVGTPQDPVLRAISLITPWLIIGLSVLGVGYMLMQWYKPRNAEAATETDAANAHEDKYRQLLEQDLAG